MSENEISTVVILLFLYSIIAFFVWLNDMTDHVDFSISLTHGILWLPYLVGLMIKTVIKDIRNV